MSQRGISQKEYAKELEAQNRLIEWGFGCTQSRFRLVSIFGFWLIDHATENKAKLVIRSWN